MLLTNTHVSRLRKTFAIGSSANKKLSETQLQKTGLSGGFLRRLLGPLLKTRLSLMKALLKPLAKSILIQLELISAESATNTAIQEKIFGFDTGLSDLALRTT